LVNGLDVRRHIALNGRAVLDANDIATLEVLELARRPRDPDPAPWNDLHLHEPQRVANACDHVQRSCFRVNGSNGPRYVTRRRKLDLSTPLRASQDRERCHE
jgi:hypothetical protein